MYHPNDMSPFPCSSPLIFDKFTDKTLTSGDEEDVIGGGQQKQQHDVHSIAIDNKNSSIVFNKIISKELSPLQNDSENTHLEQVEQTDVSVINQVNANYNIFLSLRK